MCPAHRNTAFFHRITKRVQTAESTCPGPTSGRTPVYGKDHDGTIRKCLREMHAVQKKRASQLHRREDSRRGVQKGPSIRWADSNFRKDREGTAGLIVDISNDGIYVVPAITGPGLLCLWMKHHLGEVGKISTVAEIGAAVKGTWDQMAPGLCARIRACVMRKFGHSGQA